MSKKKPSIPANKSKASIGKKTTQSISDILAKNKMMSGTFITTKPKPKKTTVFGDSSFAALNEPL